MQVKSCLKGKHAVEQLLKYFWRILTYLDLFVHEKRIAQWRLQEKSGTVVAWVVGFTVQSLSNVIEFSTQNKQTVHLYFFVHAVYLHCSVL